MGVGKAKNVVVLSNRGRVSKEQFQSFELAHSIKLPQSFKDFISEHDAPWIEGNHFHFKNPFAATFMCQYTTIDGVDSRDINFLGFNESPYEGEHITECQKSDGCWHVGVIVFGLSANGDYICFDFRENFEASNPPVMLMFHDAFDGNGKMLTCQVAETFDAFMDSLYKP